ncbi:MAG TPA: tRNA guanosine(34) transglycosylase Tgt [Candidatus Sumerlaeota bacterium]|nr:tRNA guanosine(34) transglycosylase Tgt [Candidatus Sumerlaeota bacterium]
MSFAFAVTGTQGSARAADFTTPRGVVRTPCFMPVGTRGTVKGITPRELREAGSQIILANTFHLHLRPGEELIERLGGLHAFMGYDGPILTDSGGFQVFSLTDLRKLREEGVAFKSPIDGADCFLSPEIATGIQRALGANIIMAFDECPPATMEGAALRESTERTLRWLERCLSVGLKPHQCMFPIVQGGMDAALRVESARRTLAIKGDAVGYAVGGLAVGEPKDVTYRMLEASIAELPANKPRYMMGIGTPLDLVMAVDRGVDMFDCVLPTRNARNARVFVPGGGLNLRNAEHRDNPSPIMEGCDCYACKSGFSRAYLHHLHKSDEMLGGILASIHNIRYLIRMCEEMRAAILGGKWEEFKASAKVA